MSTVIHEMVAIMGRLLTWGVRGGVAVIGTGLVFIFLTMGLQRFLQNPSPALQLQAFEINYQDMAEGASAPKAKDANWDGAMAGFSMGYAYGSSVPLVGPVVGPLLGAILGYRLDQET